MKKAFVFARVDATEPRALVRAFNFCIKNEIDILNIHPGAKPTSETTVLNSNGKVGFIPVHIMYCAMEPDKFKKLFGVQYSEENSLSVMT